MRRRIAKPVGDVKMNMTPMIDVTFLLIVFFMAVSELSRMEAATPVALPDAVLDDHRALESTTLVLNVSRHGRVDHMGRPLTRRSLRALLLVEVRSTGRDGVGYCRLPLLIRADRGTSYRHVEQIIDLCTQVGLHRVSFATAKEEGT